jgi:hypothetical protein
MRRWILIATSAVGMVAALAMGPLGGAAAAPYVYGCVPALYYPQTSYLALLQIYNGSASTANVTHKILAGNGTLLNATLIDGPPVTSSIPATRTETFLYTNPDSTFITSMNEGTKPASVRIVSNVPVSATLSHNFNKPGFPAIPIICTPQQP